MPVAVFLAASLVGPSCAAIANEHAHGVAPASRARTAQQFAADANLRKEMQGVRAAVEALSHYEHGHLGPEQAVILAGTIEGHVNAIIAKCKLPSDADAALHAIIVPLMQGAGALKRNPRDLSPISPMRVAMEDYDRVFPGSEPE
jgi:hypothetical protein